MALKESEVWDNATVIVAGKPRDAEEREYAEKYTAQLKRPAGPLDYYSPAQQTRGLDKIDAVAGVVPYRTIQVGGERGDEEVIVSVGPREGAVPGV